MKGLSAIITIVLILMIVVALAALAYTWFTGIFFNLTGDAQSSVESTTEALGVNFRIETAKTVSTTNKNISVVVRSVGTSALDLTKITAYVNDEKKDVYDQSSLPTLNYGDTVRFYVNDTSDPTGKTLKIIASVGLEQTTTVT